MPRGHVRKEKFQWTSSKIPKIFYTNQTKKENEGFLKFSDRRIGGWTLWGGDLVEAEKVGNVFQSFIWVDICKNLFCFLFIWF